MRVPEDQHRAQRRKIGDRKLFAGIVQAHKSGIVLVSVNAPRLNRPGSPVWNRDENIAPLIGLLSIAFIAFFVNVLVGFAATLLAVLVYVSLVRTWVLLRVSRRALGASFENLANWELLWRKGGLALRDIARGSACCAPHGDWRAFASANLPIQVLTPAESRRVLDFSREDATLAPSAERPMPVGHQVLQKPTPRAAQIHSVKVSLPS